MGQKLADRVDNIRRIEWLRKITAETGRDRPVFVFRRCETGYRDNRREPFVFGIRIANGLQQLISVRVTDAYIGDNRMCGTMAKRLECSIDRLCGNDRCTGLLKYETQQITTV